MAVQSIVHWGEDKMVFKILVGCPVHVTVASDIDLKIMMLNYFCLRSQTKTLLQFYYAFTTVKMCKQAQNGKYAVLI